jgi:hypothetical protein
VKHRFAYYSPKFWQPGLLITLKSGKAHFFSVSSPGHAVNELRGFLAPASEARAARNADGVGLAG